MQINNGSNTFWKLVQVTVPHLGTEAPTVVGGHRACKGQKTVNNQKYAVTYSQCSYVTGAVGIII